MQMKTISDKVFIKDFIKFFDLYYKGNPMKSEQVKTITFGFDIRMESD